MDKEEIKKKLFERVEQKEIEEKQVQQQISTDVELQLKKLFFFARIGAVASMTTTILFFLLLIYFTLL